MDAGALLGNAMWNHLYGVGRFVILDSSGFLLPPTFEGAGKLIRLTRGFWTIVSDKDADFAQVQWYANFSDPDRVYARNRGLGYLHRHIVQPPDGFVVDHRNGCTLDNRRGNLRIATVYQNNGSGVAYGTTGLRGVTLVGARYRARIKTPTGRKSLGCFTTKEEAGATYDEAAREIFGEFAWVNYPPIPTIELESDIPF